MPLLPVRFLGSSIKSFRDSISSPIWLFGLSASAVGWFFFTVEDVLTAAKNQDKLGGGLHTSLDQSGSGLEVNFQAEKSDTPQSAAELDANEQSASTNTQSVTRENVQTTAKNQDKSGGGLHTSLDQSGTGLEVDFSAEKSDTPQMAAESDVNEEVVSTNTQSTTRENVQTTAENQDKSEGGLHTGLDQSGTGLEGDFQAEKSDPDQMAVKPDVNEQSLSTNAQSVTKENVLGRNRPTIKSGGERLKRSFP